MGKRNKIRYQSEDKEKKRITLSGTVYLEDSDAYEQQQIFAAGDLKLYARTEIAAAGFDYFSTGYAGYFKLEVWDGKQWCLVITDDIFTAREHRFSKKDCPIDSYELCAELLENMAGTMLERTYREHYMLLESTT